MLIKSSLCIENYLNLSYYIFMNIDPTTTYKLMILYMLNKVTFMMNLSQIRDYFLSKEYTSYFTFQNIISDLIEAKLIEERKTKTSQKYSLT